MAITIGINGFGNWEKFTYPCIRSIEKHEPDARVLVIDNHSDPPYPKDDFAQIVRVPQTSYAGMMNLVVQLSPSDWYFILNNDTTCTGEFLHLFEDFKPENNYGSRILKDEQGRRFIETWMIIFSQQSYDKIGAWDEKFLACGFEDADWGFRAEKVGVGQVKLDGFPFRHCVGDQAGTRWLTPNYGAQRGLNKDYCIEKHGHIGEIGV